MGVGTEAGEEHVDRRATEGRVSVGVGAPVRKARAGEALQCLPGEQVSFIGAHVSVVVIGEAIPGPAKAR